MFTKCICLGKVSYTNSKQSMVILFDCYSSQMTSSYPGALEHGSSEICNNVEDLC